MNDLIDTSYYKAVLDHNITSLDYIKQICEPLVKNFGISCFGYAKLYNRGNYSFLTNDLDYLKVCLPYDYFGRTKFFKSLSINVSPYRSYKLLWPAHTEDDLIERLSSFNIFQGFNILRRHKNFLEACFFGTRNNNNDLEKFYIDYSDILEKFCDYFINQTNHLYDTSSYNYIGVSPYLQHNQPYVANAFADRTPREEKIAQFLYSIQDDVVGFKWSSRGIVLTSREIECLSHLSSGKTLKQIAQYLNIKTRTAEKHIDNIRDKTECRNKVDLIHWFEDNLKWL